MICRSINRLIDAARQLICLRIQPRCNDIRFHVRVFANQICLFCRLQRAVHPREKKTEERDATPARAHEVVFKFHPHRRNTAACFPHFMRTMSCCCGAVFLPQRPQLCLHLRGRLRVTKRHPSYKVAKKMYGLSYERLYYDAYLTERCRYYSARYCLFCFYSA